MNNMNREPHQNQNGKTPNPPHINTRPLPPSYTYNRPLPNYISYNPNQPNIHYGNQQAPQYNGNIMYNNPNHPDLLNLPKNKDNNLETPNPSNNVLQEPFILNQSLPTGSQMGANDYQPYRNEDYIFDMEKLHNSFKPMGKNSKIYLRPQSDNQPSKTINKDLKKKKTKKNDLSKENVNITKSKFTNCNYDC